jgi:RHS repeat-associated protein
VTWTYDPAYARVTAMVDGTGTTTYTYHPPGQLGAGQVATVDGPLPNDVITYSYDQLGRVTTRAIDSVPLTLTYDTLGRVEREVNGLGTFDYTFDGVSGRLATVTYPNNQTSAYTYLPAAQDHRLQTILHRYPNGATLSKFDYTYDIAGNILTWRQQADTTAVIWDYGYDNANQLIRAVKRGTDPQATVLQRFAYGYDPAGNRLYEQIDDSVTSWTYDRLNRLVSQQAGGVLRVAGSVNEPARVTVEGQPATVDTSGAFTGGVQVAPGTTRFTITATDASGNSTTQSYDVDQTGAAKTFAFDANGNMASDGTRTVEWDARNQPVAVSTGMHRTEFRVNGLGHRVRATKIVNGVVTSDLSFVPCGPQVCEEREAATNAVVRRDFAGGVSDSEGIRLVVRDQLGSPRSVNGEGGVVIARYEFDPFGRIAATQGGLADHQGFTGHAQLVESRLVLSPTRIYDPELARWMSPDPMGPGDGPNPYTYTENSPITQVDPDGRQSVNIQVQQVRRYRDYLALVRACRARITQQIVYACTEIGGDGPTCSCQQDSNGCWRAVPSLDLRITVHVGDFPRGPSAALRISEEAKHVMYALEAAQKIMDDMERLRQRRFSLRITCAWACRSWVNNAKDMLKDDPTHDTNPHPY